MKERLFKGRNYKRLLGIVLALVMVCTLLPLASLAADAENVDITEVTVTAVVDGTADITADITAEAEDNSQTAAQAAEAVSGETTEANAASDEIETLVIDGEENAEEDAETPEGRGETWDILYSELVNGNVYAVGTRIYLDTQYSSLYFDSFDAAVNFGYIDAENDPAYRYHYAAYPMEYGAILTLADTYDCTTNCGHTNPAVKSGGYWVFNNGYGEQEFYGTTSSGNGGTMTIAVTGVTLDREAMTLTAGGTEILTATVAPDAAANRSVVWSSDNPDVATVADGVVTAVSAGTANITVTTEDGGKTATCAVTVKPAVSEITYVLNDGSWAADYTAPATYTEGIGQALPTADKLTKNGYTFAGWYEAADLSGSAVTDIPATATGAKTFYAKWEAVPAATTAPAAQNNAAPGSTSAAKTAPQTGDSTDVALWIVLTLAAATAFCGCAVILKRRHEN